MDPFERTSVLALQPQLPTPPHMSSSSLSLHSMSGMELDLVSAFALRVGLHVDKDPHSAS